MVQTMIIKQGECISFTPSELKEPAQRPASPPPAKAKVPEPMATYADLLREVERLVRANERLTLERDQLREELSRQSLRTRHEQLLKDMGKAEPAPRAEQPTPKPAVRPEPPKLEIEPVPETEDDPGMELARVVVNWFWEDADEASVRLVRDALSGQGVRTIVRESDAEPE
jgi:hypothetical protein